MTTSNITDTNTTTTMRALPAPGGLSKKQDATATKCSECKRLDTSELAAWADRVGWCLASGQYRAADIERACDSFSNDGRKK